MKPINQAFYFLKHNRHSDIQDYISADDLSIFGDNISDLLSESQKRLNVGRMMRPWGRYSASKNKNLSDETRKFPSLRHLESFREQDAYIADVERLNTQRNNMRMAELERRNEERRAEPLNTKNDIRWYINRFRESEAGEKLLEDLEAHQKENKIRNITGEERLPLTSNLQIGSAEDAMTLEAIRGNSQPLQDLRAKKEHEKEFYQPSPIPYPYPAGSIVQQPPVSPLRGDDPNFFDELGDLFG